MWLIVLVIGFIFGALAWSQILLSLFYSWPLAKKMEWGGFLKRPIPVAHFIAPALIWIVILALVSWALYRFLPSQVLPYSVALGISFFIALGQLGSKTATDDFLSAYKGYIKTHEDLSG